MMRIEKREATLAYTKNGMVYLRLPTEKLGSCWYQATLEGFRVVGEELAEELEQQVQGGVQQ